MITYRKVEKVDIPVFIDLRIDFMKEVRGNHEEQGEEELRQQLLIYFDEVLQRDEFVAWLALDGDTIIGTSGMSFYRRPPSFKNLLGKGAYIMNMYTLPNYRGKGIAKQLFQYLIDEAKVRGYTHINLHATEMGRPVYQSFGFKPSLDEMVLDL